jgi:hypothetical protein
MTRLNQPNANGHDDGADNPNPNLRNGQPVSFSCRIQTIEDAKKKQRHEAKQIEMGRERGMPNGHRRAARDDRALAR